MKHLLESFIINLHTAKVVIAAMKKENPRLQEIKVPNDVWHKIQDELAEERGWEKHGHPWTVTTVLGVWINKDRSDYAPY